jgi:hypothetical protein
VKAWSASVVVRMLVDKSTANVLMTTMLARMRSRTSPDDHQDDQ